jgi:hypothetical protein
MVVGNLCCYYELSFIAAIKFPLRRRDLLLDNSIQLRELSDAVGKPGEMQSRSKKNPEAGVFHFIGKGKD